MEYDAVISDDKLYRYSLTRTWDKSKKIIMFVGLNPSTADHKSDDPTIRRCINYAKSWEYGGLIMCNLFAFRATIPKDMKAATDPIGVENYMYLKKYIQNVDKVLCMWGNDGVFLNQSARFTKQFKEKLYYVGINKSGEPKHLLYSKKQLQPIKFYN